MPGSAEITAPQGMGWSFMGAALGASWISTPRLWPKLWPKYLP